MEHHSALNLDPVCGITVYPRSPAGTFDFEGKTYYFCNPSCRQRFAADPGRYLRDKPAPETVAGPVEYVCPMDPEISSTHPGNCPKCGMALEPKSVRLDEGPNPELIDLTRRFWV